jgi:Ca2+-binding RTX toxin-like protein
VIKAKGGDDTIESLAVPDVSAGTDRISAGAGFDTVYPAQGRDVVTGGADVDQLFYGGSLASGLTVDLAAGTATGAVEQTVPGFEFVAGTAFDDVLRGTDGPNELRAFDGDDRLFGRGGDDVLLGMEDADDLFGGEGEDNCDYIPGEGDTADSCDPF